MVRSLEKGDAQGLLTFFRKLVEIDPERVERVSDAEKITLEQENNWLDNLIVKEEKGEVIARVGIAGSEIVVEGEIHRLPRWIERHVAEIRFGMIPGNEQITKELLKELLQKAQNDQIEILIYFHLRTQKTGIGIIKELGFEESGVIKDYYKRDGEYIDRIYLVKNLKSIIRD